MNSADARPNPFTDPPETPTLAYSQVKVDEDVQTGVCTSDREPSDCMEYHYRQFQIKTIKEEEAEDENYPSGGASGPVGHITPIDQQNGGFLKKEEPEDDLYMENTLKVLPCSSCSLSYTLQIDLEKHIKSCQTDINENQLTPGEIKDESLFPTECLCSNQTSSIPSQNKPSNKELERKTHHCSEMWEEFQSTKLSRTTPEHSHTREEISLLTVWEEFFSTICSQKTPENSHRREKLSLLPVWEEFPL